MFEADGNPVGACSVILTATNVVPEPNWNSVSMENDLALIRLSAEVSDCTHNGVTYSPIAKLDDAAGLYTPNVGSDATVAGWGNWRFSGPDTDGNGWGDNSTEVWRGTWPAEGGRCSDPAGQLGQLPPGACDLQPGEADRCSRFGPP